MIKFFIRSEMQISSLTISCDLREDAGVMDESREMVQVSITRAKLSLLWLCLMI